MAVKYIIRRREFVSAMKCAVSGGGRIASYGRWHTLETYSDLADAEFALQALASRPGLYQVAIFHRQHKIKEGKQ